MNSANDTIDPYFYARHDGRWQVRGPGVYGEVALDEPWLDKNIAFIVAKLLSGNVSTDPAVRLACFTAAEDLLKAVVQTARAQ